LLASLSDRAAAGTTVNVAGSGLRMNVDFTLLGGPGYRPVRITVTPTGSVRADRTLLVELLVRRGGNEVHDLRVIQHVDIPATAGTAAFTLTVPRDLPQSNYIFNVFEDGKLIKPLSFSQGSIGNADYFWAEVIPSVVIVGNKLPDTSKLAAALHVKDNNNPNGLPANSAWGPYGSPTPSGSTAQPNPLPTAVLRSPQELPDKWIDYNGLDIVCLSINQLAQLRSSQPQTFRALVAWIAAGGNIWVSGLGQDWRRVPELESLLDIQTAAGKKRRGLPAGWNAPEKSLYGREPPTVDASGSMQPIDDDSSPPIIVTAPKGSSAKAPERPHFISCQFQTGLIVAFAADNLWPGDDRDWRWVLDSMGAGRWLWAQRHGLSEIRENADFWKMLIPGVGLAPVTEFCVLITVFVIAIGPVNYWFLWRRRKLHILLVTIPAAAVAVTVLLFTYALVSDGLSVRVRSRSVTSIDQHTGRAVCWTRLSYFAGLAPSSGLHLPGDVVFLPLDAEPHGSFGDRALGCEANWDDDQHLASGWLPSRTPTQFVAVRSRDSSCGLDLIPAAGAEKNPSVRNRLKTPIQQLLVRDNKGDYYAAAGIAADATAALEPISLAGAKEQFGLLQSKLDDDKLVVPQGMDAGNQLVQFGASRNSINYYRFWQVKSEYPGAGEPGQKNGLLEQVRARSARPPAGAPLLQPGSYVALVDRSPEVVFGVPAPHEEPSSHVIFGNW
jgi:hypothetical protein